MKAVVSEGNRPGVWWGVLRSRCFDCYGSGRRARTRDGGGGGRPGKKMTGRARTSVREERERPTEGHWASWPMGRHRGERRWAAARPKGRLAAGPIGSKVVENSFPNKILIFEYTKALEICRRRFMRNFDMRILLDFLI
jgi:hypothetical protein